MNTSVLNNHHGLSPGYWGRMSFDDQSGEEFDVSSHNSWENVNTNEKDLAEKDNSNPMPIHLQRIEDQVTASDGHILMSNKLHSKID